EENLNYPVGKNCIFSSRRRHTRFSRDWSSDVCSSDLSGRDGSPWGRRGRRRAVAHPVSGTASAASVRGGGGRRASPACCRERSRSEERRVGRERREPW